MSESFAELFEESLQTVDMEPGSIVTGVVIDIDNEWVTVHAGLKSEGVIPLDQFTNANGECSLTVGDEVQVALETVEDGFGETKLSREKAKRAEAWKGLEAAHLADEVGMGVINGKVKETALDKGRLRKVLKEFFVRLEAKGLVPKGTNRDVSGISLRAGGVTEAAAQGLERELLAGHGRWRSVSGVESYDRQDKRKFAAISRSLYEGMETAKAHKRAKKKMVT